MLKTRCLCDAGKKYGKQVSDETLKGKNDVLTVRCI